MIYKNEFKSIIINIIFWLHKYTLIILDEQIKFHVSNYVHFPIWVYLFSMIYLFDKKLIKMWIQTVADSKLSLYFHKFLSFARTYNIYVYSTDNGILPHLHLIESRFRGINLQIRLRTIYIDEAIAMGKQSLLYYQ